ncbi:peptidase inhibitor family I36 protein [Lentzea sp. E54]|uniref:peptidase inhibitor family I36 protein n=1 Tax=Lentzea xerophila TaxID=3435883 RepID=UPI003DA5F6BA
MYADAHSPGARGAVWIQNQQGAVMQTKRRIYRTLAVLLAAVSAAFVAPQSASAHYSQCPAGGFCMWEHSNYEGMFYNTYSSDANVDGFNDKATSFWNRSNVWVTVHQHANFESDAYAPCVGCPPAVYCAVIAPGASSWSVGEFNDKATSVRRDYYQQTCVYKFN